MVCVGVRAARAWGQLQDDAPLAQVTASICCKDAGYQAWPCSWAFCVLPRHPLQLCHGATLRMLQALGSWPAARHLLMASADRSLTSIWPVADSWHHSLLPKPGSAAPWSECAWTCPRASTSALLQGPGVEMLLCTEELKHASAAASASAAAAAASVDASAAAPAAASVDETTAAAAAVSVDASAAAAASCCCFCGHESCCRCCWWFCGRKCCCCCFCKRNCWCVYYYFYGRNCCCDFGHAHLQAAGAGARAARAGGGGQLTARARPRRAGRRQAARSHRRCGPCRGAGTRAHWAWGRVRTHRHAWVWATSVSGQQMIASPHFCQVLVRSVLVLQSMPLLLSPLPASLPCCNVCLCALS